MIKYGVQVFSRHWHILEYLATTNWVKLFEWYSDHAALQAYPLCIIYFPAAKSRPQSQPPQPWLKYTAHAGSDSKSGPTDRRRSNARTAVNVLRAHGTDSLYKSEWECMRLNWIDSRSVLKILEHWRSINLLSFFKTPRRIPTRDYGVLSWTCFKLLSLSSLSTYQKGNWRRAVDISNLRSALSPCI